MSENTPTPPPQDNSPWHKRISRRLFSKKAGKIAVGTAASATAIGAMVWKGHDLLSSTTNAGLNANESERVKEQEIVQLMEMAKGHNLNPNLSKSVNTFIQSLGKLSIEEYNKKVEHVPNSNTKTVEYHIHYDGFDGGNIASIILSSEPLIRTPRNPIPDINGTIEKMQLITTLPFPNKDFALAQAEMRTTLAGYFEDMKKPHKEQPGNSIASPHYDAYTENWNSMIPGAFNMQGRVLSDTEIFEHDYVKPTLPE